MGESGMGLELRKVSTRKEEKNKSELLFTLCWVVMSIKDAEIDAERVGSLIREKSDVWSEEKQQHRAACHS
jgi:hypothetical protein